MSLFGGSEPTERYGAIIDVGSGSVLAAIVHSDPAQPHPTVVWSHREHAPLRNIDSLEQSAKAVMTALVNVTMLLDSEGRKALHAYSSKAKLTHLQCTICAPWSYTVTKTINYNQEKTFTITNELIAELSQAISDQINGELKENEALQNLGLQVTTRATMDMLSNGYHVLDPVGEKAKHFTVAQATVVTQQCLNEALAEMHDKLFRNAELHTLSFVLMLHSMARDLLPDVYDVCLLDVTYEATELGIVRDGTLSYSTHTPFGSFSLAREISAITDVPLHEAFGYLHTEQPYSFMDNLSKDKRAEVETLFDEYTGRISDLFNETGDALSIPKRIALHADPTSEPLFLDLVEKAVKRNIKTAPRITSLSQELAKRHTAHASSKAAAGATPGDIALLLSAEFFHKEHNNPSIEYF